MLDSLTEGQKKMLTYGAPVVAALAIGTVMGKRDPAPVEDTEPDAPPGGWIVGGTGVDQGALTDYLNHLAELIEDALTDRPPTNTPPPATTPPATPPGPYQNPPPQPGPPNPVGTPRGYLVTSQPGNTPSVLAQFWYHNATLWARITAANTALIGKSANYAIPNGTRLLIPSPT